MSEIAEALNQWRQCPHARQERDLFRAIQSCARIKARALHFRFTRLPDDTRMECAEDVAEDIFLRVQADPEAHLDVDWPPYIHTAIKRRLAELVGQDLPDFVFDLPEVEWERAAYYTLRPEVYIDMQRYLPRIVETANRHAYYTDPRKALLLSRLALWIAGSSRTEVFDRALRWRPSTRARVLLHAREIQQLLTQMTGLYDDAIGMAFSRAFRGNLES